MSNVLWANILIDGEVICDEEDKYALYDRVEELEEISKQLSVHSFEGAQDFTDMQFCLSEEELPDGIESTDEIMAQEGTWICIEEAKKMISSILDKLKNDKEIASELEQVLSFINENNKTGAKFNFSVVM